MRSLVPLGWTKDQWGVTVSPPGPLELALLTYQWGAEGCFFYFHLCDSPTVYQLQQEAPRPKRMTCPQEVGTSVNLWTMGLLLCDGVVLTKPVNPCHLRSSWLLYLTNWWDSSIKWLIPLIFWELLKEKYTIHWKKIFFKKVKLYQLYQFRHRLAFFFSKSRLQLHHILQNGSLLWENLTLCWVKLAAGSAPFPFCSTDLTNNPSSLFMYLFIFGNGFWQMILYTLVCAWLVLFVLLSPDSQGVCNISRDPANVYSKHILYRCIL